MVNSSDQHLVKSFPFDLVLEPEALRTAVQLNRVIVLKRNLELDEQILLTKSLGEIEPAWEDAHPACKQMQLMDSRLQKKINIKSSSRYWHLDRSFMKQPTRYTILHAKRVGPGARGTQFIDSIGLFDSLPEHLQSRLRELHAIHDFSFKFPSIMKAKNFEAARILAHENIYPATTHPLVRRSEMGESLYFSELCVKGFVELCATESTNLLKFLSSLLNDGSKFYEHQWQEGDTLIWDNFTTIHRTRPDCIQGLRILHRSTAS